MQDFADEVRSGDTAAVLDHLVAPPLAETAEELCRRTREVNTSSFRRLWKPWLAWALAASAAVPVPAAMREPQRAAPLSEVDHAVAEHCGRQRSFGGVVDVRILASSGTLQLTCIVGHKAVGSTGECTRNCSYDLTTTTVVRLGPRTRGLIAKSGCSDLLDCSRFKDKGPAYPAETVVSHKGLVKELRLDEPAFLATYGDRDVGAWFVESSKGGRLRVWGALMVPLSDPSRPERDAALLISARSIFVPSLRAALNHGVRCGDLLLVNARQLSEASGSALHDLSRPGAAVSLATVAYALKARNLIPQEC